MRLRVLFALMIGLVLTLYAAVPVAAEPLLSTTAPVVHAVMFWMDGCPLGMLIEHYDLEVFTPPCDPGAERFAARARLTIDISEVLPYLNATLHGAVFHRTANALTWKKGGHNLAFHAYEIATSNVEDRETAVEEVEGLIALINRTWERRAEITPDYETRLRPTPMAIYQLLPLTNCKRCGEPTCFTFALKLAASQKKIADCPSLSEPLYASKLTALQAIVIDAPTIG